MIITSRHDVMSTESDKSLANVRFISVILPFSEFFFVKNRLFQAFNKLYGAMEHISAVFV